MIKEVRNGIEDKIGFEMTEPVFSFMKTADNQVVPWLCSQTDLLADDWGIVE